MPGMKKRKKEPLTKGFSSVIFKWFRSAMLKPAKSNKKRVRLFNV